MATAPAFAADPLCFQIKTAVLAAMKRPFHIFIEENRTYDSATHAKGAPTPGPAGSRSFEEIFTGSASFIQVRGKWQRSPVSFSDVEKDRTDDPDAKEVAQHEKCAVLADEAVGGEAASVYDLRNPSLGVATRMWISKSRRLPLKATVTTDVGTAKTVSSLRYDYTNVRPPPGVK
ncbi:MAG TPA: hypothetical protein VGF97_16880 [Rhizomicrobium sp.]|jgi:hypothetical protein